jgi:hypothetical protein
VGDHNVLVLCVGRYVEKCEKKDNGQTQVELLTETEASGHVV